MYIRTSFVCSTLRVSSIRIFILINPIFNTDEDNKQEFGEYSGGSKKVRRVFKEPTDNMNLLELSHKKFSPESQKK